MAIKFGSKEATKVLITDANAELQRLEERLERRLAPDVRERLEDRVDQLRFRVDALTRQLQ